MTDPAPGRELLGQAIDYALVSADLVTPALLACATPCSAWDLGMLLVHLGESLEALAEGFTGGAVCLLPTTSLPPAAGPPGLQASCDRLRAAAARRAAGPGARAGDLVAIGDHSMPDMVLTCTGAIELAVHGWDIAAACGMSRPLPAGLAVPLLAAAPALIPDTIRPGLFAPPRPAPMHASPGDRLLAFLGRAVTG